MEIYRLSAEHFYPLRDLLTAVFTRHNGAPTEFDRLFPRLFAKPNAHAPESHLGAFIDGKLIGTAAMYPLEYVVGGHSIRLIANGNVAVHEDYRGRGVMSALLQRINQECDQCGDLCYLHGDPVRYGRVGYVGGGVQYTLRFTPAAKANFLFRPMQPEDVPAMNALSHLKTDYILRRDEDFLPALSSCGRTPTLVLDGQTPIGYLALHAGSAHVEEYALASPVEANVFPSLACTLGKPVSVTVSGYDPAAAERCKAVATLSTQQPALFRSIHPERLQKAALSLGLEPSTLYAPYLT